MPIEAVNLAGVNEEEDYAMLPQIQQALEIMLNHAPTTPTATVTEGVTDVKQTGGTLPKPVPNAVDDREGAQGLAVGEDAIGKNSVEPKALVGIDEAVEAAAQDNRNFIRVIVGGEPYLALLDPGATI